MTLALRYRVIDGRNILLLSAPVGYLDFSLGVKADTSLVSLHPFRSVVPGVSVVALAT